MIDAITTGTLWDLLKNAGNWLTNLRRANKDRQKESINALRKVVVAARKTSVYMRQLKDTAIRSYKTEEELTIAWTELSFALEDLGVQKLAKRCHIQGMQWADPQKFNKDFLEKADISLEKMELIASQLILEINR